jgi:hypothetical protein
MARARTVYGGASGRGVGGGNRRLGGLPQHPRILGLSVEEPQKRYTALLAAVRGSELLAGFRNTQFADTDQESNGLLYPDRRSTFPIEHIAAARRGTGTAPKGGSAPSVTIPRAEEPPRDASADDADAGVEPAFGAL